ncbi:MAG: hypothetical protein MSS51_02085, partial [Bacteroidales bacterium]|nr:hypothetical protein [Bacteroidales bacterium]
MDDQKVIHAYKGFDKDLKCRGFAYEIGKDYEQDGGIKCCENGFHACEFPLDVFNYYAPGGNSRYCTVTQSGVTDKAGGDSKVASSKIHIETEIGLDGIIKAGVKFILDKVNWNNQKKSNTGDRSAATNTGDRSAATNTGYYSAATNTGDRSAATNTGYCSAATNTGDRSAATNTGYCSAATNTGYCSAATNTGDRSAATNTGDRSAATNTGDYSAATNTGYCSAAKVSGKESVAIVTGRDSKAAGALGDWIVLTERGEWNGDTYPIKEVKAFKVDGEKIKADTFYKLVDGEAV